VKLALWTPEAGSLAAAAPLLAREHDTVVVGQPPEQRPEADADVYELRGAPAYGYVYRALLERPGLVLLHDWNLHALVFAETAGRGSPHAYRREARRAHGDVGAFAARQVLAGLGGALIRLVPMNRRVLEASLGLVSFDAELAARAAALLPGRPVLALRAPESAVDEPAVLLGKVLLSLVRKLAAELEPARREAKARRAQEATPLGAALAELAWAARELGLPAAPDGVAELVTPLFPSRR
jgi:hypothetical protein